MSCQEIIAIILAYKPMLIGLFPGVEINISSEYSFITAETPDNFLIRFEVNDTAGKPMNTKTGEEMKWPGLRSKVNTALPYPEKVIENLAIADRIAALAVNCTTGDNYRPGNFSEVLVTKDFIELSQVNHMNAKSLAHKKDYSLRSLVFKIPVNGEAMTIKFSDRSSENNKRCGDRIEEALKSLNLSFSY